MSDMVVGAIIGIGGVIIGGILTSINNWVQIKHQEKEALIGRRAKAREGYLVPLREALSKYMSNSIKGVSAYAVLKEMQEKKMEPEMQTKSFETVMASLETGTQIMEEIDILSEQTHDTNLSKMMLDFKNQQIDLEITLRRHSKWFANRTEIDSQEWNKLLQKYNSVVSSQRDRLIPINRRIEELLSGQKDT